jgi:eukaryotic-like serine/threonine-protein kinase
MATDRWDRLKELFDGAMELEPSRRAEFLDGACGGDAALRAEVEKLIRGSEEETGWVPLWSSIGSKQ